MTNFQALMDGMSAQLQRERSSTQMTLGELISVLESLPKDLDIDGLSNPHSYRGYYCDLAFERTDEKVKVEKLLNECKSAMGKVFVGYKGGDYVMGELTPIWVAFYGTTGERLIDLLPNGHIETAKEDDY